MLFKKSFQSSMETPNQKSKTHLEVLYKVAAGENAMNFNWICTQMDQTLSCCLLIWNTDLNVSKEVLNASRVHHSQPSNCALIFRKYTIGN